MSSGAHQKSATCDRIGLESTPRNRRQPQAKAGDRRQQGGQTAQARLALPQAALRVHHSKLRGWHVMAGQLAVPAKALPCTQLAGRRTGSARSWRATRGCQVPPYRGGAQPPAPPCVGTERRGVLPTTAGPQQVCVCVSVCVVGGAGVRWAARGHAAGGVKRTGLRRGQQPCQ